MSLLWANDRPGAFPASAYAAGLAPASAAPLVGDHHADLCVVGAGLTGLSAALHCAEAGLSVTVLEAHRAGFGASGRNGGQLTPGQRIDASTLEARYGRTAADALWALGADAVALVNDLCDRHAIACHRRPGVGHAVRSARGLADLGWEADFLARRHGHDRIELLDAAGIARETGSPAFAGGWIDWGGVHLDPLQLTLGLARAAQAAGATLHEGAPVTAVQPGARPRVITAQASVRARHVVLAANGYLGALSAPVARRVMPINNFIVATEPLHDHPEVLPRAIAVDDDRFVVSYWRKDAAGRLLFGGGESYGYRFPQDIRALVRRPLARIYPQLAAAPLPYAWGGTLAITRSRLPHLARPAPGVWSAGGYSGHGLGLAPLAGRLIAQAIAGDPTGFDRFAGLPDRPFPCGTALRPALLRLAMGWFALRDRLGR